MRPSWRASHRFPSCPAAKKRACARRRDLRGCQRVVAEWCCLLNAVGPAYSLDWEIDDHTKSCALCVCGFFCGGLWKQWFFSCGRGRRRWCGRRGRFCRFKSDRRRNQTCRFVRSSHRSKDLRRILLRPSSPVSVRFGEGHHGPGMRSDEQDSNYRLVPCHNRYRNWILCQGPGVPKVCYGVLRESRHCFADNGGVWVPASGH